MSAVISGLVGAVVAYGLVSLAERNQKPAAVVSDGWKALRSGWLIKGLVVLSTAITVFIGNFLLSGGSSLPDAAKQNAIASLLLAAFAAYALNTAWIAYGRTIMWKGYELRIRSVLGRDSLRRITDVSKIKKFEGLGEYHITFRDRTTLRFSAYMHGANELVAKLPRRAICD